MLPEELMREVRLLELRAKRRVDDLFAGDYHSAFKGQGIEFAEVREYEPGDDVRTIDWNVTARTGRPFVKRYAEERQNTVMLAMDRGVTSWFGTRRRTKARLSAEIAAVLAFAASRNQDRVGMATFSRSTDLHLPPRKGRGHLLRIIREALDEPTRTHEPDATGGLNDVLKLMAGVLHRRSIVFVLSDFLDSANDTTEHALRRLTHKHDVTLIRVADPMELAPPALGVVRVRDPRDGRARAVNLSRGTARRYTEAMQQQRALFAATATRSGASLVDVSTEGRPIDTIAAHLRSRSPGQRRGTRVNPGIAGAVRGSIANNSVIPA